MQRRPRSRGRSRLRRGQHDLLPALPGTPFTSPPPTPGASASSGLAVSYTSNSTGVCTVTTGGTITFVSAGTCSLTATQTGDANYAAATSVTQTFPITAVVITFSLPALRHTVHQPAADARRIRQLGSRRQLHVQLDRRVHGDDGWRRHLRLGGHLLADGDTDRQRRLCSGDLGDADVPDYGRRQHVSFPTLPGTPFTSPPPTPGASASSGLAVSYTSNTTGSAR